MQERSSCSVSSASHQFCTLWLQLTPSTWHAGCRIVQRPFRWLAEEQSRLWNRLLRASAIGPGHLLAVGTKDQAVGRLRATSAELGSITAFLRPYSAENTTYPQSIFKYVDERPNERIMGDNSVACQLVSKQPPVGQLPALCIPEVFFSAVTRQRHRRRGTRLVDGASFGRGTLRS